MKTVKLKRLVIDRFRGQNLDVSFGKRTDITGRNRAGKSTILNAFLWVLTGCDIEDRTNFQLFDNNLPMTYENAIPVRVDAFMDIDGNEYKFTRIAQQAWVRERGKSEYTKKDSDKYTFLIDDVELSSGDFKRQIEELFVLTDCLKVILNIKYIFSLGWKEQRLLFSQISDEIDETCFKGKYDDLFYEMSNSSLDNIEARIKTNTDILRKETKSLPLTIEALVSNLPDVSKAEEAKAECESLKQQISNIDATLEGKSKELQPIFQQRREFLKKISELKEERLKAEYEYQRAFDAKRNKLEELIDKWDRNYQVEVEEYQKRYAKRELLFASIKRAQDSIQECDNYRKILLAERDEAKALTYVVGKCSYCGQLLPEDKAEEEKLKFIQNQKAKVARIVAEGKKNNTVKEELEGQLARLQDELKQYPEEQMPTNDSKKDLLNELADLKNNFVPFTQTSANSDFEKRLKTLESEMPSIPEDADCESLTNVKNSLIHKLEEASEMTGLTKERKKQETKIEDFRKRLRAASDELANWEKLKFQLDSYKQEKAELVSKVVNKKLNRCKVEMMSQTKSGEWIPSCTITTNGVQSPVYNKAEKILSGVDISNAFMRNFDLNMPLFIDDAESISSWDGMSTERQFIQLFVGNTDLNINAHE